MNCIFNGEYIHSDELKLDIQNRAFQYGDGLFETMFFRDGSLRFPDYHLERLKEGCKALGMDFPGSISVESLTNWVSKLTVNSESSNGFRVKLTVWRSSGGRYAPVENGTSYLLTSRPQLQEPTTAREYVVFSQNVKNQESIYSRFKTLSSLKYVIAGKEMLDKGADDILITDTRGFVSEALYSNIFWVRNERFYTPGIDNGCIAGTMRRHVIATIRRQFELEIGDYNPESVLKADQVFLTNSLGISPIRKIGDTEYSDLSIPKLLLPLLYGDGGRTLPV